MGHYRSGTPWRWPGGAMPYIINDAAFPPVSSDSARQVISDALDYWNRNTLLNFRERESGDANWIEFVTGDDNTSCHSQVGRQPKGGATKVYCNPNTRALYHELGHAVG